MPSDRESSTPSVFALVLNWNRLDFTGACCQSLERLDAKAGLHVIVIDNASTAHTPDDLKRACPKARVLALSRNGGFAYGMNAGIRLALSERAEFIWLLNNDTVCKPGALTSLLACMKDPAVGIASSRLIQASPASGNDKAPAPLVYRGGLSARPPFYIPFPVREDSRPDFLCGASLLMRSSAVRQIGPLDEGFPFFFEDADYSFRAKKAGWELAETSAADIIHKGSATIGRMDGRKARWYRLGHVRFLRRHGCLPFVTSLPPLFWRLLVDTARLNGPALVGSVTGWAAGWKSDLSIKGAIE